MPFFAIYLIVTRVAAIAGSNVLKARKHRKPSLRGGLLAVLFPAASVLLNLVRPSLSDKRKTPEEQKLERSRFSIESKQESLEKRLSRQDKLEKFKERSVAYRVLRPDQWFPETRMRNNAEAIRRIRGDIREEYGIYGLALRRAELSGDERFLSVRMLAGADTYDGMKLDGRPVFRLPFDISRQQEQEIRSLLAQQFGIDPNDDRIFERGTHRAADRGGYGLGWTVLEFDAKEKRITPFGADLPEDIMKKVEKGKEVENSIMEKYGLGRNEHGIVDGLITLTAVGREAVALEMGGVVLAYAVAGSDGKVRAMGTGVDQSDRGSLRVASALNERLKGCMDLSSWVDRALEVVNSSANVRSAVAEGKRKETVGRQLEKRKAMRRSILNAPGRELRKLSGGLKKR